MKKTFAYLAAAAVLAASCAPAVQTTVLKSYPAVAPDSVVVYSTRAQVPGSAEALGNVRVYDGGFTTQCDSLTVVNLVKLEAGKMGGNAALITEHKLPSFWTSTCHQMTATALRISGLSTPLLDTAAAGQLHTKPARTQPRARFALNMGYGRILAKTDPSLESAERWYADQQKSGFAWDASTAYFFNDALGIGLDYSGYLSTASSPIANYQSAIMKTTNVITYVGPSWIARSAYAKWILECSLSLGYFGYYSQTTLNGEWVKEQGSTLGGKVNLGAEYRFHKNWGVGASLQTLSGVIEKTTLTDQYGNTETITYKNTDENVAGLGLGQLRFQVGIRYYIK